MNNDKKEYMVTKAQGRNKKTVTVEIPEGYSLNDFVTEKKTQRMQLVMQPSLALQVKAEAERAGVSVNEYIHAVLKKTVKENEDEKGL